MRNVLLLVVLLVLVVVVIGFKQRWLKLTTSHNVGSSNIDVHLKVDGEKAKSDAIAISHLR